MQLKRDLPITIAVGLLITGFVLLLSTFGPSSALREITGSEAALAPIMLAADGSEPPEGAFKGEVTLEWGVSGVLSDNTLATPPSGTEQPDLGSIDLGLLLQPNGSSMTAYVDLDHTLIFTSEHTIQATPVGPTPLPGTPPPAAVPLKVGPKLMGSFDGTNLELLSAPISSMIAGKTITQQFSMKGVVERTDNLITFTGEYRETVDGYMPQPVTMIGSFMLYQVVFPEAGTQPEVTATATATATAEGEQPTATATATATATTAPANTATATATSTTVPVNTATATPTSTATPTATATSQPVGGATVNGVVYDDRNGNGSQESDEPGIGGAKVTLSDGSRSVAYTVTAVTDGNGAYTFANVPIGQYTLQIDLPAGQNASTIPSVTVNVAGKDAVTVPSVPVQMQRSIYLPSVNR